MERWQYGIVTKTAGPTVGQTVRPYSVTVLGRHHSGEAWLDRRAWPWGPRAALAALMVYDEMGTGSVGYRGEWFDFVGGVQV